MFYETGEAGLSGHLALPNGHALIGLENAAVLVRRKPETGNIRFVHTKRMLLGFLAAPKTAFHFRSITRGE